jgi:uncharacterized membrane protein YpjA
MLAFILEVDDKWGSWLRSVLVEGDVGFLSLGGEWEFWGRVYGYLFYRNQLGPSPISGTNFE